MISLLLLIASSLICAVLYRMGGYGKPFKSWMRDWLIPLVICAQYLLMRNPHNLLEWILWIPIVALTGGALSTYWDFLFGKDNFYMHGFMIGISCFPLAFIGIAWWIILIRAVILALSMGLLCKFSSNVWVEECGRGALIAASIPILLI